MPNPAEDPVAVVAEALERARTRGLSGWHRVAFAVAGDVERRVRALPAARSAVVYHVQLRPWLARTGNTLEALYPYRMLAREARAGALAIVRDAEALFDPALARWRDDPLGARVVRRVLIGSRLPTVWCTPAAEAVGAELLAQAPVLAGPWDEQATSDAVDGDFLVWARTD